MAENSQNGAAPVTSAMPASQNGVATPANPNGNSHAAPNAAAAAVQIPPHLVTMASEDNEPGVCRFWKIGLCKFGDSCWLVHAGKQMQTPQQLQQSYVQPAAPGMPGLVPTYAIPVAAQPVAVAPMPARNRAPRHSRPQGAGPAPQSSNILCRFHSTERGCRYGEQCRYKHVGPGGPAIAAAAATASATAAMEALSMEDNSSPPVAADASAASPAAESPPETAGAVNGASSPAAATTMTSSVTSPPDESSPATNGTSSS